MGGDRGDGGASMRVYLASPLGFAYSTRVYMLELEKALAHADVVVVNP